MISLIIKDIKLIKRQIIIGLVLILVFSYIMSFEEQRFTILLLVMVPMLLFNSFVGKMCYYEDKDNVFRFIKALPISKNNVVLSKFIECILTIFISYSLIFIINVMLTIFGENHYELDFKMIIFLSSGLLIYFSVFLFIFFKANYAVANQTVIIFFALFILLYKVQNFLQEFVNLSTFGKVGPQYIFLIISLFIMVIMYRLSVKAFLVKE